MSTLSRDTLREASMGEVAALSLKAARGAGYDWGLAEEAADAVRVLHRHGYPGAKLLLAALGGPPETDMVRRGAHLSDRAASFCANGPEELTDIAEPTLLLPFILRIALRHNRALHVSGLGVQIVCLPDGRLGDAPMAAEPNLQALRIAPANPPWPDPLPQYLRAWVAEGDWARLSDLAARTYAPATEASRLRGAGAAEDPES